MNERNAGKNNVICPPCGENVGLPTKRGANRECLVWPLLPRLMTVLLSAPSSLRSVGMRNIGGKPHAIPRITGQRGDGACGYGFTLIELLVVVLIIGILAAVALPQYQKAVKKAQGREVLVALEALDNAFASYALEHGSINDMVRPGSDAPIEKLGVTLPTLKYFKYKRVSGSNNSSADFFALGSNTDLGLERTNAIVKVRWNQTTGIRTSTVCEGDDCDAYFTCKSTSQRQQCAASSGIPIASCPTVVLSIKICELE